MLILMLLSLMRYLLFHFFWPPSFPCPLHTLFPSESMPLVDISATAIWRPDWFDGSIQCGDNSFFIKLIISFALRISCKLHDFKKRTKAMIIYKRYVFQLILSSFTAAFIFASVKKWGLGMWLNFSAGLKKIQSIPQPSAKEHFLTMYCSAYYFSFFDPRLFLTLDQFLGRWTIHRSMRKLR